MSNNQFIERGKVTINSGIERGTIAAPNDATRRKVNFDVTARGHLSGFVQPANDRETIALRMMKKQIRARTYVPDMPAYAALEYREVPNRDGVLVTIGEFVFQDVTMGDGSPLRMAPGSVFLFNHLEQLPPELTEGERAAFSGFAVDWQGNLTEPAAWRRQTDGRTFYSGDNRPFNLERYLAARATTKDGGAAPTLPDGATAMWL